MTTALFLLRCKQAGFSLEEIDELQAGLIFDVLTEQNNDAEDYAPVATQEDFDNF